MYVSSVLGRTLHLIDGAEATMTTYMMLSVAMQTSKCRIYIGHSLESAFALLFISCIPCFERSRSWCALC